MLSSYIFFKKNELRDARFTLKVSTLTFMLVLVPLYAFGDANVWDWYGEYSMNHDGLKGILTIQELKADCMSTPWCAMNISYTDSKGKKIKGDIEKIDKKGQHMVFYIHFPGNKQKFDGYIFSWDKSKLAGTTYWGGRTFGFYATRKKEVLINRSTNYCLDTDGKKNGAVRMWECGDHPNQSWELLSSSGGKYQIRNIASDNCLDTDGRAVNGGKVIMRECYFPDPRVWKIVKLSRNRLQFKNEVSGYCLDTDGRIAKGAAVRMWKCADHPNQTWTNISY